MDADSSPHEPLVIGKSTNVSKTYMGALGHLTVFLTINLFVAVLLSYLNAAYVMREELESLLLKNTGGLFASIIDFRLETPSILGQALSIFGLCFIVARVKLIWTGRVTRPNMVLPVILTSIMFSSIVIELLTAEMVVTMIFVPSKLRSKMLLILGYELIGFYVLTTSTVSYDVCSQYNKLHNEGREVPWSFSVIISRIMDSFISMTSVSAYILNAFFTVYSILIGIYVIFFLGTSSGRYDISAGLASLAITGVIVASIILSIIASSLPSFKELDTIFRRHMRFYTLNLFLFTLQASSMIGFMMKQSTGCSGAIASIVYKSTVLIVLTAVMVACFYFKLTMAYFFDLHTADLRSLNRLPLTEAAAPLAVSGCESQSTDRCTTAELEDATAHNEIWRLTGSTAITGISSKETLYNLLPDSESEELSISACEISNSTPTYL
jgi:hypothetical protein